MLIKDWDYKKFLDNILNFKCILIHGQDRGKVNEKSTDIINKLTDLYKNSLEVISFEPEAFYQSQTYIYELIYQKSFFSKISIIRINLDLIKGEKDLLEVFKCVDSYKSNFIIIESNYLLKNSSMLNLFNKTNNFALIPCYQETNIKQSIIKYANLYSLKIDAATLDYLSDKFGNDTLITKNEIEKLSLYANGEAISYEIVLKAIGDNSDINLNKLIDSIGIEDQSSINYLYKKIHNLGLNYIVLLRALSKHVRLLLEAYSKDIKNAKEIRPLIHFSRHKRINKQLKNISQNQLRKYLVGIHNLEISCKLNYSIQELLIKEFLLSLSNY